MKINNCDKGLLTINIKELNQLSEFDFKTTEILVIELGHTKALPPLNVDLSTDGNTLQEEIEILDKLLVLKNFKSLKALYLSNIYLSKIPVEIIALKHLEYLQFNYYRFFDPKMESRKIAKFKRLKALKIDEFYLPKEKIETLKIELAKLERSDIIIE